MHLKDDMLGQKIKALRLARGMTQAALSGDTITRNMLSQIENGVAQPSVSTIMELAEKLDTPVEYFFSENGKLDDFKKLGAIAKIKKYYAAGDYAKCLNRLDALGVSDDETEYLYAKSSFAKGCEAYRLGALRSAVSYFEAALSHGACSIYVDEELCTMARAYMDIMGYIASKDKPLSEEAYVSERCVDQLDDILYIHAIADEEKDVVFGKQNSLYAEHLALRKMMTLSGEEQTERTLSALKGLLARCDGARYAVMRYFLYCDLEKLASSCGDYKCAYECSSERLLLAEKMNH